MQSSKLPLLSLSSIYLLYPLFVSGVDPPSNPSQARDDAQNQAIAGAPGSSAPYFRIKLKYKPDEFVEDQFIFHSYRIEPEYYDKLKNPNTLAEIKFNGITYVFEVGTKLPTNQSWTVQLITCEHNVPIMMNIKSLVENYLYALNPETGKWANKTIDILKRYEHSQENGIKSYRLVLENEVDKDDTKFLDYFSDECALICRTVCNNHEDDNLGSDEPPLEVTIKYADPQHAEEEQRPEGREDEERVPPQKMVKLNDLLVKNELYYIIKTLRMRLIKLYSFSTGKILEAKGDESYIESKDEDLEGYVRSLNELIIDFYSSDSADKWLDLLSRLVDKFYKVKEVIDKVCDEARESLKNEDQKIFVHNVSIYKTENFWYLLYHFGMIIEKLGEEFRDSKFQSNLENFNKDKEEAKNKAKELVDADKEKKREELFKEIRKKVENASGKVINVVESTIKERKKNKLDVNSNYVSNIKTFLNKAIDISRVVSPGLISILLSAVILTFI